MTDYLGQAFPELSQRLPKTSLADLPTPVDARSIVIGKQQRTISLKHDEHSSKIYGGNKVRKLEYLLRRACDRNAQRVATFGTVASNHALATALHAASLNLGCTCFLSHQIKTANVRLALNMHLQNGTEIVHFGGDRAARVRTLRRNLSNQRCWVIPVGGSTWLGVLGFINAGLELAEQIDAKLVPEPQRLYVANGTMATSAGLALGLALAGLRTEVHAVRVTHDYIANPEAMRRLIAKTVMLMNRFDASFPADLGDKVRLIFRDEFFGGGYAHTTEAADKAIGLAREQLGLALDTTYTGKAMAALLHDARRPELADQSLLFWNTYNSRPLPVTADRPEDTSALPAEFLRYFD